LSTREGAQPAGAALAARFGKITSSEYHRAQGIYARVQATARPNAEI